MGAWSLGEHENRSLACSADVTVDVEEHIRFKVTRVPLEALQIGHSDTLRCHGVTAYSLDQRGVSRQRHIYIYKLTQQSPIIFSEYTSLSIIGDHDIDTQTSQSSHSTYARYQTHLATLIDHARSNQPIHRTPS